VDRAPATDLSAEQIDAMTAFVASLPPPLNDPKERTRSGQRMFRDLDCAKCHVPKLGDVDGIYSDLLLHDMKPDVRETGQYQVFGTSEQVNADQDREAEAKARADEWRTSPLWGIGKSAPYMHDGQCATLEEAILEHGGEAENASRKFSRLSESQREILIQFLKTL
jgi:CxxC motif-containing protein (DUF1111 family)